MIEFLTSDSAIFLATGLALTLTTLTIVRDTRNQHAIEAQEPVLAATATDFHEPDQMELAA
jgi:hypothetical protein